MVFDRALLVVEFSKLAGVFADYRETGHLPESDEATFLRVAGFITNDVKPDTSSFKFDLSVLRLAGRCERIFRLRHDGVATVVLVGAILPAHAFGAQQPEPIFAGGRGLTMRDALVGCMCELAERVASRVWAPGAAGLDCVSVTSHLPVWSAAHGMSDDDDCVWVEGMPLGAGAPLSFPWRGREGAFGASAGCAVGSDVRSATLSAVLELLERDAVALWWYGGRKPRKLDQVDALSAVFGAAPSRNRWLVDLTTERGVPVVAALSSDRTGKGLIVGAAADLSLAAAAHRAALELCQMEASAFLSAQKNAELGDARLTPADRLWVHRLSLTVPDHAYPTEDIFDSEPVKPESVCAAAGPAYAFDLSIPEMEMTIMRVIAPSLRTMASSCIGEDSVANERERRLRGQWAHLPPPI